MKRSICSLLAVLLLTLTACGGGKPVPANTNADLHPEAASQGRADMLETADGVYSVWTNESGRRLIQMIYFCPAGESTFYPLCSKPDCRHDDENCNAYAGIAFGYCSGYLYTAVKNLPQQRYDVVRMNPDGTERTVVTRVPCPSDAGGVTARFHGGKLYLAFLPNAARPLEEQIPRVVVVDLETLEQAEPFAELFTTGGDYALFFECFNGDKAYISGAFRGEALDDGAESYPFIELDAAAGTYRRLFDLPNCVPWVEGDTCYYVEYGEKCVERDLTTGEEQTFDFPESGDGAWAIYDKDYVYLMGEEDADGATTLYILTRDYELVDEIRLANGESLNNVSSRRLLFANDSSVIPPYCAYLDKSQIGSGNLELQPITVNG